jgi:hypothetical protein
LRDSRQQAAGSGQRAAGSGQRAAGSGQRAAGSGQQAAGSCAIIAAEVMMPIKNYQDLIVWQKAMDLAEATYRLTQDFPREE